MNIMGVYSKYRFRVYKAGAFDIICSNNSEFNVYSIFGTYYHTTIQASDILELLIKTNTLNDKVFITFNNSLDEGTYPILNYDQFDNVIDIDNKISGRLEAIGSTPIITNRKGKFIKTREGLKKVKRIDKLYIDNEGVLWSNFGKVLGTFSINESCVIYITEDLFVISQYGRPVVYNEFMIRDGNLYCIDDDNKMVKCDLDKMIVFRKVLENELQNCDEDR